MDRMLSISTCTYLDHSKLCKAPFTLISEFFWYFLKFYTKGEHLSGLPLFPTLLIEDLYGHSNPIAICDAATIGPN